MLHINYAKLDMFERFGNSDCGEADKEESEMDKKTCFLWQVLIKK